MKLKIEIPLVPYYFTQMTSSVSEVLSSVVEEGLLDAFRYLLASTDGSEGRNTSLATFKESRYKATFFQTFYKILIIN
jgi:hypothetical protein